MELAGGHAGDLRCHDGVHAEVGEGTANQAAGESHELGTGLEVLSVLASFSKKLKAIVLQNVYALVVGSQVVDLLSGKADRISKLNDWPTDLNIATQKSLQMNLSKSSSSLNFGKSLASRSMSR